MFESISLGKLIPRGYSVQTDAMLLYFLSVIDVRADYYEMTGALNPQELKILEEIRQRRKNLEETPRGKISESAAWTEAYRLERMMVLIEPPDNLLSEIRLRLDEAALEQVPAEPRLRNAFQMVEAQALDTTKSPPQLHSTQVPGVRALLLDVLEETHWAVQRKYQGRPIQKVATQRIVWAGLISFLIFVSPYLLIYIEAYRESKFNIHIFTGLPIYTALTSALFGAYFSRLHYIQARTGLLSLGELRSASEWTNIVLRGCVGMCGGLVIFFFLRSGIIDGSLFPNFGDLGFKQGLASFLGSSVDPTIVEDPTPLRLVLPSPALALLALWCFLAGFSERLVPTILSSTESQLADATKAGKK